MYVNVYSTAQHIFESDWEKGSIQAFIYLIFSPIDQVYTTPSSQSENTLR